MPELQSAIGILALLAIAWGFARLGEHGFRIRTATGISEFRTFWVGAFPVIDEKEPNNAFDTPQPIPLNVTGFTTGPVDVIVELTRLIVVAAPEGGV